MSVTTVLLVSRTSDDADRARAALSGGSFDLIVVASQSDAGALLVERGIDCVLLDLSDSDDPGSVLSMLRLARDIPVLVLILEGHEELGRAAVEQGADAYIVRAEIDESYLQRAIHHATVRAPSRSALRDSSAHLRAVLDSLDEGVLVRAADGTVVSINARAEQILGVGTESWRVQGYVALSNQPIFNEDGSRCSADDLPSSVALRTGHPVIGKVLFVERPDATRVWIECTATLLRSEVGGPVIGVVTAMRDLSDRRSADESLRFRSDLLDAVGQAVVATDLEGTVVYWNRAAEATYGWTAEEALGSSAELLLPSDASRETAADIFATVVSGETWTGEFHVGRRDGSTFLAWVSDTPVLDVDGNLIAIIGVSSDMTELHAVDESLHLQSALLAAVGQCVVATDVNDRVVYWNAAATREFGWTEEEILGQDASATLAHESRLELARELEEQLRQGKSWMGDLLMKRKDGSVFTASVSTSPVVDDDGNVVKFIAVMADVTERREAEEAMRRLSAIVESTGDAVIGKSLDGRVLSWNAAAERLTGFTAAEVVGSEFTSYIPEDRIIEFRQVFHRATEGVITEDLESTRLRKDGSIVEVSLTLSPWRDADGRIAGVSTIARDISDRKRMERMLEHQALHDSLTGLPNRTLLIDRVGQALVGARRRERQVALLLINIEDFKELNDAAGHPAGDAVLVEIAERLRIVVRPSDTVARFGGVEFVVLCEASHLDAPMALAERLQQVISAPVVVDGESHLLSASIGIALSDEHCTVESILRDGDEAMHQAKSEGRGRITLFDAAVHERASARLAAPAALRRALDNGEFSVHFQPVLSVADERTRGFEALVRWEHPERGLIPPSEFIGLAEESGLIVPLGDYILRRSLDEAQRWMTALNGEHLPILSVNLSARQLVETDLPAVIAAAIDESGWPASRLALEVTESVIMEDVAHSIESLRALRAIGVRVSIDDFGTGYSSLSYLKQLPVDALKIDRSFVSGLGEDRHDSAIVEAIMALAKTLELYVIAEGVETRQQFHELRRLGCDYAQGFLWAPALTADNAMDWVVRGGPKDR